MSIDLLERYVGFACAATLFTRGAGDGNRTRTVSLGTACTHGVCAWLFAIFVVLSGLECPLDACRNGTLMARSRSRRLRSAQRSARRAQLVQGRQGVRRQVVRGVPVAVGPRGKATLEREDAQLTGEVCCRVGHASSDQCVGHGSREADVPEGIALLELGTGSDRCLQAGAQLAVHRAHFARRALETGGDRLQRTGSLGCLGDPLCQQPTQRLLPGGEQLALVREVPEEGALGDPSAFGDLRNRRGVVPLLGEQVDGSENNPLASPWPPARSYLTSARNAAR